MEFENLYEEEQNIKHIKEHRTDVMSEVVYRWRTIGQNFYNSYITYIV